MIQSTNIEFPHYCVVNGQLYLEWANRKFFEQLGGDCIPWKDRVGIEKWDKIEKIDCCVIAGKKAFRTRGYMTVVWATTTNVEIELNVMRDLKFFILKKGQHFVIPSHHFYSIIITPNNETDFDSLVVRDFDEPKGSRYLMSHEWTFFWPIFGTKIYFWKRLGNCFFYDLWFGDDDDKYLDEFEFTPDLNDCIILMMRWKHLDFVMKCGSRLPLHVEASKWKRFDIPETNDDQNDYPDSKKICKVTIYETDETINKMKHDSILCDQFLKKLMNDEVIELMKNTENLTKPSCLAFWVEPSQIDELKNYLNQAFDIDPNAIHMRIESIESIEQMAEATKKQIESAEKDHTEMRQVIKEFYENNLIFPLFEESDEDLKKYESPRIWDVIFKYTSHLKHFVKKTTHDNP